MANKISTVIDFVTESAKSSLASLRSSISEAEGAGGKFKAGFASLKDSVNEHAGAIAAVGGAALVSFGVKAVGAFTETAKAAIDLGTSTGLSTEQASRWIAVGDDFQVGAEALATGLGKVSKTLDDTKWQKYGIDTRDASGKARSANDILLDSFDVLSKVTNKTEQARIGQELFGKGYQSLTPILGHTRAEYEKMLSTVERGQVITDEEAKKAERFRLAQDQLGDALRDVTIQIGAEVAALSPLIEVVAKVIGGISGSAANQNMEELFHTFAEMSDAIVKGGHDIDYWIAQVQTGKMTVDQAKQAIHDATLTVGELAASQRDQAAASAETDRETRKLPQAWELLQTAEEDATAAQEIYKYNSANTKVAVKQDIDEMIGKWNELTGDINADKSWVTLQGQFADVKTKFEEANKAIKDGTDDAAAKTLAYKGALDDVSLGVLDYGKNVLSLPPEQLVTIKSVLEDGDLQRALDMVAILTRNKNINIAITARGGPGYNDTGGPSFDQGGVVGGPVGAPVRATVHGGERVLTVAEQNAIGSAGGLTVNLFVAGSVQTKEDLIRGVADGLIDLQRRGVLPAGIL